MAVLWATAAHGAGLTGVGDLPGGATESYAYGVSGDGSVVTGFALGSEGAEAFRWTLDTGMVGLGDLPGGPFESFGAAISRDGSTIVGEGTLASGVRRAFRWTQSSGMVGLGDLPGGVDLSTALAVSADGAVIVGGSEGINGLEAFRWTQAGGMVGLGDLPGGLFRSQANGVSADGSVVVGVGYSAAGPEAIRWTSGGGMVGLGDLAGGAFSSTAFAVSDDGSVVIGLGASASGDEAFRWTQAGGMVGLGDLPGGIFRSVPSAMTPDGSVIVGVGSDAGGDAAFFWNAAGGMQSLEQRLTSQSVALGAWQLRQATGVSADGRMVVGTGVNPSGLQEGWIAVDGQGLLAISDVNSSLAIAAIASAAGASTGGSSVAVTAIAGAFFIAGGLARRTNFQEQISESYDKAIQDQSEGMESNPLYRPGEIDGSDLTDTDDPPEPSANPADPVDPEPMQGGGDGTFWQFAAFQDIGDERLEGDALQGVFGASVGLAPGLTTGLGVTLGGVDSSSSGASDLQSESAGLVGYAAFADRSGLRLGAVGAAEWSEQEIDRKYFNGVTPVSSSGRRDVRSLSGAVHAGWFIPLTRHVAVTPFTRFDAIHVDLSAYRETSGPFPVRFDAYETSSQSVRAGAQAAWGVSASFGLWASAAWVHTLDGTLPDATGEVLGLGLNFRTPGGFVDEDAGETEVGFGWTLTDRLSLQGSLRAVASGGNDPNLGAVLGIDVKL